MHLKIVHFMLTDTGNPLQDQVLQHRINDWVMPGVQLIPVDPNVEAEPVWVGVRGNLTRRSIISILPFSLPLVTKKKTFIAFGTFLIKHS